MGRRERIENIPLTTIREFLGGHPHIRSDSNRFRADAPNDARLYGQAFLFSTISGVTQSRTFCLCISHNIRIEIGQFGECNSAHHMTDPHFGRSDTEARVRWRRRVDHPDYASP
jgi:hypothetical protein